MSDRGRMRSEKSTTQAYRELDHFKPIQDSKGFGLTSVHFEAESGAWTLALVLKDWTGIEVAPFQWTVCQLAVYVLVMAACMSAS